MLWWRVTGQFCGKGRETLSVKSTATNKQKTFDNNALELVKTVSTTQEDLNHAEAQLVKI